MSQQYFSQRLRRFSNFESLLSRVCFDAESLSTLGQTTDTCRPADSVIDLFAANQSVAEGEGGDSGQLSAGSGKSLVLQGALPQRLRIVDSSNVVVLDNWFYRSDVPIANVASGKYTVLNAASGQPWRKYDLDVNDDQLRLLPVIAKSVDLPGTFPQRIRVRDALNQTVFDHFVYQNPVGLIGLEVGNYQFFHAASGQSWQEQVLTVFEDYAELSDPTPPQPEGEGSGDLLRQGEGKNLVIEGDLPQRLQIVDRNGQIVSDAWYYSTNVTVAQLDSGDYSITNAASGKPWRKYELRVNDDSLQLTPVVNKQVELAGQFPRRLFIRDLDNQVVFDNFVYQNPVVLNQLAVGDYRVLHASSGQNWQKQLLAVYEEYAQLTPLAPRRIALPDSDPRFVVIKNNDGAIVQSGWSYSNLINMESLPESTYLVIYAKSSQSATELQVTIGEFDFTVVDVTPVDRIVQLSGPMPRDLRIYDSTGNQVFASTIHTARISLAFLGLGTFAIHHQSTEGDYRIMEVDLVEERTNILDEYLPVLLPISEVTDVELYDEDAQLLTTYLNQGSLFDHRSLNPGLYRLVFQLPNATRKVIQLQKSATSMSVTDVSNAAPRLELPGSIPQFVQIFRADGTRVYGAWHYSSSIDMRNYVDGSYLVTRAASSEPTRTIMVRKNQFAVRAQDVTAQRDNYFVNTAQGQIGLTLGGVTADEVQIKVPPQTGSLTRGDSSLLQTYKPAAGFSGLDWFQYHVVEDGNIVEERFAVVSIAAKQPATLSYYAPGTGTVNIDSGVPLLPSLTGSALPSDVVVINQYGPSIDYIGQGGELIWRYQTPMGMRSIDRFGNQIVFANGNQVGFLEASTGTLLRTWIPDPGTAWVRFVTVTSSGEFLIGRATSTGEEVVELYTSEGARLWDSSLTHSDPRGGDYRNGLAVIADTGNHRVLGVDPNTNAIQFEIPAYFPNDALFVDDSTLLITEEHADRVWLYNITDQSKTLVLASPTFTNLSLTVNQIIGIVSSADHRIVPEDPSSKSKSSVEFSGINSLYSPNSAIRLSNGGYYIADTDNHRVIYLDESGTITSVLTGFNNPTQVLAWN